MCVYVYICVCVCMYQECSGCGLHSSHSLMSSSSCPGVSHFTPVWTDRLSCPHTCDTHTPPTYIYVYHLQRALSQYKHRKHNTDSTDHVKQEPSLYTLIWEKILRPFCLVCSLHQCNILAITSQFSFTTGCSLSLSGLSSLD